jgi:hypothetical protein
MKIEITYFDGSFKELEVDEIAEAEWIMHSETDKIKSWGWIDDE